MHTMSYILIGIGAGGLLFSLLSELLSAISEPAEAAEIRDIERRYRLILEAPNPEVEGILLEDEIENLRQMRSEAALRIRELRPRRDAEHSPPLTPPPTTTPSTTPTPPQEVWSPPWSFLTGPDDVLHYHETTQSLRQHLQNIRWLQVSQLRFEARNWLVHHEHTETGRPERFRLFQKDDVHAQFNGVMEAIIRSGIGIKTEQERVEFIHELDEMRARLEMMAT
jgi:hypothetical protein